MTGLVTYKIVDDENDKLKQAAKVACNFWNRFISPKSSIVIRLGIFTSSGRTIARAWKPYYSGETKYGKVQFNTKYLSQYSHYEIAGTVIHEIGHTLGIGWDEWNRTFNKNTGQFLSEYINIVPKLRGMFVEKEGGQGTKYSHWDEDRYDKELMTGYKDRAEHMLPVTIDVMRIFGHSINEGLNNKTDLKTLMLEAEGIQFSRESEVEHIDLEYFEETELAEEVPVSISSYDELMSINLGSEVWSLIQRGLNHAGYYSGTYKGRPGRKTRAAYDAYQGKEVVDPNWMTIAHGQMGTKEYQGDADNPDVIKYLQSVDSLSVSAQRNDETSWCSAFINWCMEQSGFNGTDNAAARSWLNWGNKIELPQVGCITVLWRESPDSWKGHVGFFIRETSSYVYLLGGNQSNEVNISRYPKNRVLGYRMP